MAYKVQIRRSDFKPLSDTWYLYHYAVDTQDVDLARETSLDDFFRRFLPVLVKMN